jgi:hypothetical protein
VCKPGAASQEGLKNFATKTPRDGAPWRQEFFYNKPLGVPLCLRAFVAIFIADLVENQENLGPLPRKWLSTLHNFIQCN